MTWPIRPMSLVVGGVVPPENVVGRVREEQEILASLPDGGAALVGDRRHGKTSLSRLVAHTARQRGLAVVSVSAERQTYDEFVTALAGELGRLDTVLRQEMDRWRVAFGTGPVRFERARAEAALDDLLQRAVARTHGVLVLFIDEVTVLARNLEREKLGAGDAFLHLLRRFRQDNAGHLATVLSGSIGFHHVSGDALSSVNDIRKVTVGPIRHDHATYLAECLLLGAQVPTTDRHLVAESIATAAENVPYYIQHLVAAAAKDADTVHPGLIAEFLRTAIADPHDPWDLRHYRDRLRNYYGDDAAAIANLLDVYAYAPTALGVDTVLQRLHAEGSPIRERDRLVSFIERLEQDHYLRRLGDDDCFASGLVQSAWRAMRR
jgi:hypothetical protein